MNHAVEGWLKAGVFENGVLAPTEAGTPQGGTVSPLLANIALQGMEEAILSPRNRKQVEQPILIRYADDVRHFTRLEIHLTEMGGSEERSPQVTSLT
jgi:RNA-directed DNA polymerase